MKKIIFPIQPIKDNRFIPNKIVKFILDSNDKVDLNTLAVMNFSDEEHTQFAQLIGYSILGFSELSYVDDEAYEAANKMAEGELELEARNAFLRECINVARGGLRQAATALFKIHPDDLEG